MLVCCALVTCHASHAFFTPVKFHFTQGQPPGTAGRRVPTIGIVAAEGGPAEGGPRPLYYPAPRQSGPLSFLPFRPNIIYHPRGTERRGRSGRDRRASGRNASGEFAQLARRPVRKQRGRSHHIRSLRDARCGHRRTISRACFSKARGEVSFLP